jgi:hypothetical protein
MITLRSLGFLLLGLTSLSAADPELKDTPLTAVKASVKIPADWHLREDNEDGVIVYQVSREKLSESGGSFTVGFTLSVTPDVPGRAQMPPSKYAMELLSFSVEDGGEIHEVKSAPFQTFRTEYSVDGDAGALKITDVATANDTTGTLYFFAWQTPGTEDSSLAALREQIIGSLKFDPSF